jgi:hypothetical protein
MVSTLNQQSSEKQVQTSEGRHMHGREKDPRTPWSWLKRWGIDVISTVGIFAVLGIAQAYLKDRPFGRFFRNFEYAVLEQTLLAEAAAADGPEHDARVPIVVDISQIPVTDGHTDRGMLRRLVASLQRHQALAIGVDIDFSPDYNNHFISTEDGKLLGEWKDMGNVVVGVFRQQGQSPGRWLGRPDFRSLAGGIMLPEDDPGYAYQYSSPDQSLGKVDPEDYLLQMPAALSAVVWPDRRRALLESPILTHRVEEGRLALGAYAVDYSSLDQIKRETIAYSPASPSEDALDKVAGRVVLLGDILDARDSRCTPLSRSPVAGVWIHGCAFTTLNRSRVARHIDESTSHFYDTLLLLSVLVLMAIVRFRASDRVNGESVEVMLFSGAAFAVVVWSVVIIEITQVFWPDFLWVSAALFMHPYLKQIGGIVARGVKGFAWGAARA